MYLHQQWRTLFIVMVTVNAGFALVNLLLKKVLSEGLNLFTITTYRQSASALFLAPIAYFFERRNKPSFRITCCLFFSALLGGTLSQILFLIGLRYTSAGFSCAFINMVPVLTFLLALPFGQEKVNLKSKSGIAKVSGAFVCIGGVLLLILYKGMPLINTARLGSRDHEAPNESNAKTSSSSHPKSERWLIGSILLTASCLCWTGWFLVQAKIGKSYPFQYSSTAILSFFVAIQSAILGFLIERDLSIWLLKGKLEIVTVLYTGIVGSGLCYVAMTWCVKQRGPVFTSAFTPLTQIFAATLDVSILHEQIYLGSVMGSMLVIIGMYILLLGKSEEQHQLSLKEVHPAAASSDPAV